VSTLRPTSIWFVLGCLVSNTQIFPLFDTETVTLTIMPAVHQAYEVRVCFHFDGLRALRL
jgi:hypothetical protein